MNKREQFEQWSANHDYLGGVDLHQGTNGDYSDIDLQHAWEAWQAAASSATTCPGHGRPECATCCWPAPAGYTAVDMSTAAADGYRDGKANAIAPPSFVTIEQKPGGKYLVQCGYEDRDAAWATYEFICNLGE